jgi:hypothetical protein
MKPPNCGQGAIVKRPSEARGRTESGWLHSRHTFSFGDYFDPDQMGFRALRVINENIVEPGKGLGTLEHRDVEIITCVIEGESAPEAFNLSALVLESAIANPTHQTATGCTFSSFGSPQAQTAGGRAMQKERWGKKPEAMR